MGLKSTDKEILMQAIAHKIRTPLSIIQNELTCIKSDIGTEEYDRMMKACRSISSILKESPEKLISESGENDNG